MWENLLIALVLLICAIFVLRRFVRQLGGKATGGCACSCGEGCTSKSAQNGSCEGEK